MIRNPVKDGWEKPIDALAAKSPAFVRVIVTAGKSFFYYHCMTRAAALTYTSFLAAIPFLILLTSIVLMVGFGSLFSDYLELFESYHVLDLPIKDLIPFLQNAEHVPAGKLGLIGFAGLFVTFMLAIGSLEINFNVVWENKVSRPLPRQLVIYTPILLVFATIIGLFAGFAKDIHSVLESILIEDLHISTNFLAMLQTAFWLSTFNIAFLLCIFLLLYALPYRTRKYERKRLLGYSILCSLCSLLAIYIYSALITQIQASLFERYSLLYGSLAFLPLVLIWVFGIWSIIMFANCLVWAICNWPESGKRVWNWDNSTKNL